jgi:RES domain-containing protein
VIYSASSVSLAVLEILANYAVLPVNYSLADITIPDDVEIEHVSNAQLPEHWDSLVPGPETQRFGDRWTTEQRSAVLSVPSSVIPRERNFILNPAHPNFRNIHFCVPQRFIFDPRLRQA